MSRVLSKLFLAHTVFFRKIGQEVYVRNTATGEEFIFSEEAAPIFKALRRGVLRSHIDQTFAKELRNYGLLDGMTVKPACKPPREIAWQSTYGPPNDIALHFQEQRCRKHRLWSAGVELTYRCNARCHHCYLDIPEEQSSPNELTENEWLNVIDQVARMGCMNVLVTGGEPTLHPAFPAVCERIIKRGMLCDVYTNGLVLPEGIWKKLVTLPINSISVSLYSGTEKFHDFVTNVPGSFRKTLSNLLLFKDAGFHSYAKVPVFHNHLDEFFSAQELGKKLGFRVIASTILVPGHSGRRCRLEMMNSEEYSEFLNRATEPAPEVESPILNEKYRNEPVCQAGQSTLCVSPFGEVMPCNSFSVVCGNVRDAPLSKIWQDSPLFNRLQKLRRKDVSERCRICADIAFCTVCPGVSWTETRGQIAPCSWSCVETKIRANFNRKARKEKE